MLYNLENGRRVTLTELESFLASIVTQYDRKQKQKQAEKTGGRGYHNPYALAQYLARVAEIITDIQAGAPIRAAIIAGFGGRILDAVLWSIGEDKVTDAELLNRTITYTPVKAVLDEK